MGRCSICPASPSNGAFWPRTEQTEVHIERWKMNRRDGSEMDTIRRGIRPLTNNANSSSPHGLLLIVPKLL